MNDPAPERGQESSPDAQAPAAAASSSDARQAPHSIQSLLDWMFRNRQTGQITVGQFPNVALWIFLATVALRWVVPTGSTARSCINAIGLVALAWWALDEVVRGVNPWRRLLGLGGCAVVVSGLISFVR